jgi:hypothetical protein
MIFANDLATAGAIDAQTPAGRFRSHLLCLSYADSALQTNVLIAEVTNCQGQIISSNQVLYSQAFSDGVRGSVRYTYRQSGWEQDILIDDPGTLPAPEALGLDSTSPSLMLQVITEFVDPPTPVQTSRVSTAGGSAIADEDVDWGALRLGNGQAILLGRSASAARLPTGKRWIMTADKRHMLVEQVPFAVLLKQLLSKPHGASLQPRAKAQRHLASLNDLPRLQPAKATSKTMEYASVQVPDRGLLLDYVTLINTSSNGYTFQCDRTYYIVGTVHLSGTTVCEGGTVIKFPNSPAAKISMSGPLQCNVALYRSVVMTSKDDNTIGDTVGNGETSPTNYNGATYLEDNNNQNNTYRGLRLRYAGTGISAANFSNGVWHCQFLNCGTAMNATGDGPVVLRNVLAAGCTNVVVSTGTLLAEHLTVDQCASLLAGTGSSGVVTNSLLTAVSAVTNVTLYNSSQLSSGSGVYQTVGAGCYYLADGSTNRNAGFTNINQALANDLSLRTTYPPIELAQDITNDTTLSPQAQRDTDITDRGYHYDPLDWVVGGKTVTAAQTLILTNGVALGDYNAGITFGLRVFGRLVSAGSAASPNYIVRFNTAQEQSTATWADTYIGFGILAAGGGAQCLFTSWSVPGNTGYHFYPYAGNTNGWWFAHCQFTGASVVVPLSAAFTNCLLDRVYVSVSDGGSNAKWYLYNNLLRGGTLYYSILATPPYDAFAYDNLFQQTAFSRGSNTKDFTNGYNGYVTNCAKLSSSQGNDVILTNSPIYQTGPLGNYYYPTNDGMLSTLIDKGSRYAADAGLYQFTTTTNQVKEGGTKVDIGFHYVAVGANGNPLDTNGDGIPDYLSDSNGNGNVDSGEIGWNLSGDLGLKVLITRPRNGANPAP